VHVQKRYLKALLFQPLQGMQDGVMLKCGGNDVLFALARAEIGGGGNGLIVGLAAAGGEIDLARLGAAISARAVSSTSLACWPMV
jgi:hypothetical protein